VKCPHCGSKTLGKIGFQKYFCTTCYREIVFKDNKCFIYVFNENGDRLKPKVIHDYPVNHPRLKSGACGADP